MPDRARTRDLVHLSFFCIIDITKQSDDMWTGAWAAGEAVTCGGSAAVAAIKKPSTGSLIAIGVIKVGCIGKTLWDTYQGLKANDNTHELCVRRCRDEFPTLK